MNERPRPPFHDIVVEQELLGALILNNASFDVVAGKLCHKHFYEPIHQVIFQEIARRIGLGEPATPLTIRSALPLDMTILNKTVPEYLASLAAHGTIAFNVAAYGDIVAQNKIVRDNLLNARTLEDECFGGVPAGEAIRMFDDQAEAIRNGYIGPGLRDTSANIEETMEAAIARMEAAVRGEAVALGIPTMIHELDGCIGGLARGSLVVVAGRPGMGKAQPLWSKVLTVNGWKPMGEIKPGERLVHPGGGASRVIDVFPQGRKPVFKVSFHDGRATHCCEDHLWRMNDRHWDGWRVASLRSIMHRAEVGRISIPLLASGHPDDKDVDLSVAPYVLGVLLGDGCLTEAGSTTFTSADAEIAEKVDSLLPPGLGCHRQGKYGYRITRGYKTSLANLLGKQIADLGLFGADCFTKFVPPAYKEASYYQRLEILRGLLDTDGTVEPSKTIRFSSASEQLAEDVVYLARSLGGWAKKRKRSTPTYRHKGEKKNGAASWIVTIRHSIPKLLFSLTRKLDRLGDSQQYAMEQLSLGSIEPAGEDECQCIMIDRADGLYFTDDFIVTHNSTVMCSLGRQIGLAGYGVGILSLEMDRVQVGYRMLTDHAYDPRYRITYNSVLKGSIRPHEQQQLIEAGRDLRLRAPPIEFDFATSMTVAEVAACARRMATRIEKQGKKLGVLMIDYLKFIKATARYAGQKHYEIGEITAALKGLARQLDCCVVLFHQLNREVEKTAEKRPGMEHLRESGDVEQDADVIILLYREGYYIVRSGDLANQEKKVEAQASADRVAFDLDMIVAKQRMGPAADVAVFCDITTSSLRSRECVHQAFVRAEDSAGAPDVSF